MQKTSRISEIIACLGCILDATTNADTLNCVPNYNKKKEELILSVHYSLTTPLVTTFIWNDHPY